MLSAIELPAIGAAIASLRTKLDGIQLGGADENATLHAIAKDADDLAAYVRKFTTPIVPKPKAAAASTAAEDEAAITEIETELSADAPTKRRR